MAIFKLSQILIKLKRVGIFKSCFRKELTKALIQAKYEEIENFNIQHPWDDIIAAPNDLPMIPRPSSPLRSSLVRTPERHVPRPVRDQQKPFPTHPFQSDLGDKSRGNSDSVSPVRGGGECCKYKPVGTPLRHRGPLLFYMCAPKTNASCVKTFSVLFQCQVVQVLAFVSTNMIRK